MLQLRTELEMEKVQTRALTEEAAASGKKVGTYTFSQKNSYTVHSHALDKVILSI